MDTKKLSANLTRTAALLLFWATLVLGIYLSPNLETETLLWILGKALFASAVGWLLLTIVVDTLVKSMALSAKEHAVDARKGGLSYHLIAHPQAADPNANDEKSHKTAAKT